MTKYDAWEQSFRNDLNELLKKYNATIELEECSVGGGYLCRENMVVTIQPEFDDNGNELRPFLCIDLGRWVDYDKTTQD